MMNQLTTYDNAIYLLGKWWCSCQSAIKILQIGDFISNLSSSKTWCIKTKNVHTWIYKFFSACKFCCIINEDLLHILCDNIIPFLPLLLLNLDQCINFSAIRNIQSNPDRETFSCHAIMYLINEWHYAWDFFFFTRCVFSDIIILNNLILSSYLSFSSFK